MKIIDNVIELQRELASYNDNAVGFVPTMGAIHQGHLSLVRLAKTLSQVVVVSVFVNPTQFNDPKDLERYPRTLEADCILLASAGADILFAPTVAEIYPETDSRQFQFGTIDSVMEGASRPGHFNGVAQVVSRLFDIVKPKLSIFGEKDFQQVAVIKAMVSQLGLDVEIVVAPIVREDDGLALSSRNALLTEEHRAVAPNIYKALAMGAEVSREMTVEQVQGRVVASVEKSGLLKVIYFEIVDSLTMESVADWSDSDSIQGCIAVQAGEVRLIDNIKLK